MRVGHRDGVLARIEARAESEIRIGDRLVFGCDSFRWHLQQPPLFAPYDWWRLCPSRIALEGRHGIVYAYTTLKRRKSS